MQRNVASQGWLAFAFNRTTGSPITGDASNITGQLSKDGGTLTALATPNPTEVGLGYYRFALTQAETNAAILDLVVQSSTSNVSALAVEATKATVPIDFTDLSVDNIVNGVATQLGSIRLTLQQQLAIAGAQDLRVIQGDDYTRVGIRIDFDTSGLPDPNEDLGTYHLILAAAAAPVIAVRMDILGTPGDHYAVFNPPSTVTENWPIGRFNALYRIEWASNEYETVNADATLTIEPFDIDPGDIVALTAPS